MFHVKQRYALQKRKQKNKRLRPLKKKLMYNTSKMSSEDRCAQVETCHREIETANATQKEQNRLTTTALPGGAKGKKATEQIQARKGSQQQRQHPRATITKRTETNLVSRETFIFCHRWRGGVRDLKLTFHISD